MTIRELCRHPVVAIDQAATLADAARQMRRHHVGALAVTAEDGGPRQVVGIVTDRDLAVEALARDLTPSDVRVGQVAQRQLVAVPAVADIGQALQTMQQHGVRRLLVVEADGRLAGLVSIDDMAEALALQFNALAGVLRSGITRESEVRADIAPPPAPPVFMPAGTPGMPWPTGTSLYPR